MMKAVVGYPNSINLGDWIQSLVIFYLWQDSEFVTIDREQLHTYDGSKAKLICNGWFMENPRNWPPSSQIDPLFISFHINPTVEKEFTSSDSLSYFKKHEPIGCRDNYTLQLLQRHGIKAYFSGCLTLCYRKPFLLSDSIQASSGILVTSVFDRLKPSMTFSTSNLMMLLRNLIKFPFKFVFHQIACRRLNKLLSKSSRSITYASQIITRDAVKNQNPEMVAIEYLKKIASAELVITSRIHTALPATAMGIPVLFISDGLDHINHQSRLDGLLNFFEFCSSKQLKDIDLNSIKSKVLHQEYADRLIATIDRFLKSN